MFIHRIEDLQERADACLMDVLLGKYADLRVAYAASLALGKRAMEDGYIVTLARPVPLESDGSRGLDILFMCDCSHHPLGVTHRFTREMHILHMRNARSPSSASCRVPDALLASLVERVEDTDRDALVSLWDLVIETMRFRNDPVLTRVAERLSGRRSVVEGRMRKVVHDQNRLTVWAERLYIYLEAQFLGDSGSESFWMCEKLAQFLGTRYSDIPLSL